MTPDEFNRYCAEVMGYSDTRLVCGDYGDFDPAADLNQMAEVFDKLWQIDDAGFSMITLREKGIAQAMREFIEGTKEE